MHASNRIAAACHAYVAGDNRTLARIWSTPPGLTAVEDDAAGDPSFARVVNSQDETHSTKAVHDDCSVFATIKSDKQ
jgi:hypothetical protein